MSRLARITQIIFGNGASDIGVFGSAALGTPTTSTVIATIMAAAGWAGGWLDAVLGSTKLVAVEDLNAVTYVTTTQLAYLFQQGLAVEYDAGTTYFNSTTQSVVMQPGTLNIFKSLTDNNVGNALPTAPASNTNWGFIGNLANLSQQNVFVGGTTTGSANAQVIASLTPATGFSLSNNGQTIVCTAGFTNTGAMTVAVTSPSIAATSVKINSGAGLIDPPAGAVTATNMITLTVDSGAGVLVLDTGLPATLFLQKANNLSDVLSASTSLSNLGGLSITAAAATYATIVFPASSHPVGSLIIAQWSGSGAAGGSVSAGSLTPCYVDETGSGDSITGTWQNFNAGFGSGQGQLFQRIA